MLYLPLPLLIAAAVFDLRQRRIPNWITYTVAVLGVVFQAIDAGFSGFVNAISGLFLAMLIIIILPGLHTGGGDLKLAAGIGAWIGIDRVLLFVLYTLAAILIMAIAITWSQEGTKGVGQRLWTEVRTLGAVHLPLAEIPAAPIMCVAYFFAILGR